MKINKSAGPTRWDRKESPRKAQVGVERRRRKTAEVRTKVEASAAR